MISSSSSGLGAVILVGGASRRMGRDKAQIEFEGLTFLAWAVAIAKAAGAEQVLTAGKDYGLPYVEDPQPQAGPVAGVLRGLAWLSERGLKSGLVLAVDTPTLKPDDITPLLVSKGRGAHYEGNPLPMVVNDLVSLVHLPASASLRQLTKALGLQTLEADQGRLRRLEGANSPDDVKRLGLAGQGSA